MKRLIALLMAGFLLAALAGCSSEDSGTDESTDESAESSTTTDSNKDDSSDATTDDGDTPNIGNLDDCAEAAGVFASVVAAPFAFIGGAASDEQIAEWESQVEEFKDKVPADLQDDYDTLSAAYDEFAQALEGLSLSDLVNPATQQALQDASAAIESDDVQAAQENLQEYYESNCGQ
jgi:hypothetical protein